MTKNRKDRAAKHLQHFRTFHGKQKPLKIAPIICRNKPTKNNEDLTDSEVDQIWAEVMHIYRTEGFEAEAAEKEIEALIQADPEIRELSEKLSSILSPKATARTDLKPVKR